MLHKLDGVGTSRVHQAGHVLEKLETALRTVYSWSASFSTYLKKQWGQMLIRRMKGCDIEGRERGSEAQNCKDVNLHHKLQLWSVGKVCADPRPRKVDIQPAECTESHLNRE